jgi:diketogulonate reductase-like aldo/keto reductase
LYLIHFPLKETRIKAWKVLEKLYEEGKCKAIGVSNYTEGHLEELLKEAKVVPAVNQVEFNAFLYQKELLSYCTSKGIILEGFSPLSKSFKLYDENVIALGK